MTQRDVATALLIAAAVVVLAACAGERSWQPRDAWFGAEAGGAAGNTTAREDAAGKPAPDKDAPSGPGGTLLKRQSVSAADGDAMIRAFSRNHGLHSLRLLRSGRYTPASWDIELSGARNGDSPHSRTDYGAAYAAALAALGASPLQGAGFLDSLTIGDGSMRISLRLHFLRYDALATKARAGKDSDEGQGPPGASPGEWHLHEHPALLAAHEALMAALEPLDASYEVRAVETHDKIRQYVVRYTLLGIGAGGTTLPPSGHDLRWAPDGGPEDRPYADKERAK